MPDAAMKIGKRIDQIITNGICNSSDYDWLLKEIDRDGGYSENEKQEMQRLLNAFADGSVRYHSD